MLLDPTKVINSIYEARRSYRKGKLKKEIKNSVPISFWQTSQKKSSINKSKLIEMAKKGEPRPSQKKHDLGTVFSTYTCKCANSYDPVFDKQIRKIAPHWFINSADVKKQELIKMAQNGEPRPSQKKHALGIFLSGYLQKGTKSYDQVFDKKIRRLAPHWFIKKVPIKKQKLLNIAKKGKPKPMTTKHPLGYCLYNYTHKSSNSYDHEFTEKLRKLAPHWF